MKIFTKMLGALLAVTMLAGCGSAPQSTSSSDNSGAQQSSVQNSTQELPAQTIKVGGPSSPPSLPILRMMDSKAMGENVTIEFTKWDAMETLMAMANDSSVQFLALPLNSAVSMYNKGLDVQLMNINTWAVMSMITADPAIKGWDDLKGQTVYIPIKSSPVDYMTQTFMKEHGLTVDKDVKTQYTSIAEGTQLLLSGQAKVLVSIEPMVTAAKLKNPEIRSIVDYQKEWQQMTKTETDLPNAGLAAKGEFAKQSPETVARFQSEYEKALEWVLANPKEAGALAEKYLGMNPDVTAAAVPNMALQFKSAADSREELDRYYNILFGYSQESIGGKLPDDAFFYLP